MKIKLTLIFQLFFISVYSQNHEKYFERGNAYYQTRQYSKAIPDYETCWRDKELKDKIILKLADSYRRIKIMDKASRLYKQYLTLKETDDSIKMVYADVLKQLGNYSDAKACYEQIHSHNPLKRNIKQCISNCDSFIQNKLINSFEVENLTSINSPFADFAPVPFKSSLVFSSNREGTLIERKAGGEEAPLFDLYLATGMDSIRPDKACNFSFKLNTINHECCATFTSDYKKIFFTKSFDRPYSSSPGVKNSLMLFSAVWQGSDWGDLHTFIFNDTTRSYAHPSIDGQEEMFFFASDMEGGYGGTDIYVCFNVEGKWTNPVNLGPEVNSEYNEMYPFFHMDRTLYFSSDRPEGRGGFDIYFASENDEGEYGNVRNLGWPISSSSNDISISWNQNMNYGYFASDRKGGKGNEDIYLIIKK